MGYLYIYGPGSIRYWFALSSVHDVDGGYEG